MSKRRIVFDFDGVVHRYSKGWYDGSIYDGPVLGIKQVIDALRNIDGYEVVIMSTRSRDEKGKKAIQEWLDKYNIYVDGIYSDKPPAMVYVDDRAVCFDGDCDNLIEQIRSFKTWQES